MAAELEKWFNHLILCKMAAELEKWYVVQSPDTLQDGGRAGEVVQSPDTLQDGGRTGEVGCNHLILCKMAAELEKWLASSCHIPVRGMAEQFNRYTSARASTDRKKAACLYMFKYLFS
jgi:hypothetical protein